METLTNTNGAGSEKIGGRRRIKVKIKVFRQQDRTGLMNISWKFEIIFIHIKAMSIRMCVHKVFLNMTSLMSIIMFWRQQH